MDLKDRLTYCKICTNRDFDSDIGLFCKLTGNKPIFQHTCPSFNEDFKERSKLEERLKYRFIGKEDESNTKLIYSYPTSNKKIEKISETLPEQIEIKYSLLNAILHLIALPVSFVFILWDNDWSSFSDSFSWDDIITFLIGLGFSIFGFYKIFNHSAVGYINKDGFQLLNAPEISWDKVLAIYLKSVTSYRNNSEMPSNSKSLSLQILGKHTETNIELTPINLSNSKLLTYLEAYRKKSKQEKSNNR